MQILWYSSLCMVHPDLISLGKHTYYMPDAANIGVYVSGTDAYLIDSGRDRDAAKRVLRLLRASGLKLGGIINTHSHADHIGGNAYLQRQTGCPIWAPEREAYFITCPELEPAFLYGGFPHGGITGKLLMAKPSRVTAVFQPPGSIEETPLQTLHLPGHSISMAGILTPDGVCFTADAFIPQDLLERHRIPFLYDVKTALETLEHLRRVEASCFLPSHGQPAEEITEAAEANRRRILEVTEVLLKLMRQPVSPDDLFKLTVEHFGIMLNHVTYILMRSCINSFISYLLNENRCTLSYTSNSALITGDVL